MVRMRQGLGIRKGFGISNNENKSTIKNKEKDLE